MGLKKLYLLYSLIITYIIFCLFLLCPFTYHICISFLYIQILLKCTNIHNLIIIIYTLVNYFLFIFQLYYNINEVNVYSNNSSTLTKNRGNKQEIKRSPME